MSDLTALRISDMAMAGDCFTLARASLGVTKSSRAFDAVFYSGGIRVIRTAVRAPNANAYVERWVGSVRRECLDRLLVFNHRQLERILRVYICHYGWKSSGWTAGGSFARVGVGAGGRELKCRGWGCFLPRCLAA